MKPIGWRSLALMVIIAFATTFAFRFWWSPPVTPNNSQVSAPPVNELSPAGEQLPISTGNSFILPKSDNLRVASIAQVREQLEDLKSLYPPSRQEMMRKLLIGQWLAIDPDGAFEWCLDDWSKYPYSGNIVTLLRQWAELDPDAAISAWQLMPEGVKRDRIIPGLLWGLKKQGPESYLRCLEILPPESIRFPAGVAKIFTDLVQDDRQAAMARVTSLPEILRAQATAGIASGWMKQDPVAAVDWVRKMSGGRTRDDCLEAVLDSDWAHNHPSEAGALLPLFTNQSGLASNATVLSIFRSLKDTDPVAAGEWAITYLKAADNFDTLIEAELIPDALHSAPESLANLLNSLTEASGDKEATEQWIQQSGQFGRIESGHEEIFERLVVIEDTTTRQAALRGLIKSDTWNFDEAARALDSLSPADRAAVFPSLMESPLPGLGHAEKLDKLLNLVDQVPVGPQRNSLLAELIGSLASPWIGRDWGSVNPKEAAELFNAYPEAANTKNSNLIADIADSWYRQAGRETDELLSWAATLEEPAQREQALSSVARNLAKSNTTAASKWISTLPVDDPARDRTVAAFAGAIIVEDADAALAWAQSIVAPSIRETSLNAIVDQLAWKDPTLARQTVAAAPVEESIRHALLYRIDHP